MEDICPHCGYKHTVKELDRDAGPFCIKCGTDMVTPPSPENREGKEILTSDIEKIRWLLGEACKDLVVTSVMEYCDVLEGIDKASQKIMEVVALAENMEEGEAKREYLPCEMCPSYWEKRVCQALSTRTETVEVPDLRHPPCKEPISEESEGDKALRSVEGIPCLPPDWKPPAEDLEKEGK